MDSILSYERKLGRYRNISLLGRPGFIVNVYDPLSFDIDLFLSEFESKMLPKDIYSSAYLYKEFHNSNLILQGRTFRFRLVGITFRKDVKISLNEICKLHKYTWSLIHSCDNWVLANVVGIDTYNRFLGTIFCPKLGDLGQHLENKFPNLIEKYKSKS